jgi:hypothetical protein
MGKSGSVALMKGLPRRVMFIRDLNVELSGPNTRHSQAVRVALIAM